VTGSTEWIDLVANTSITHLKKYDIFGNVVKEEVSCCNERSYALTQANYWSQAEEATNGSGSSTPLTITAEYDFNTGAAESKTDPNSLTTSYIYDAAMRPSQPPGPTGASASQSINDGALTSETSVTYDGGTNKTIETSAQHDGWGQVIESVNEHGGQVNTTYDAMGRITSQTNPFPSGGQPGPSTSYLYDALGRTKE
jgi:YD repeat-containing protein